MKSWAFAIVLTIIPSTALATDALDWATGSWGIDVENVPEGLDAKALDEFRGCRTSPVKITADRDNLIYRAVHTGEGDFVATGPILKVRKRSISLQYDDEQRLMKNGEPQIWHMVFVNKDKFYWVYGPDIYAGKREGVVPTARIRCRFAGV
jgi:hypothetical protein